jgi:uncharacterized protein YjbI with pentapeptide repeats
VRHSGGCGDIPSSRGDSQFPVDYTVSMSPAASPAFDVDWPRCAVLEEHGQCTGIQVGEADQCLAHLPQDDRDSYLSQLKPGADIDARGTSLDAALLASLLAAVTPPREGPRLGAGTDFRGATFTKAAFFRGATFIEGANFDDVTFTERADFDDVTFVKGANFVGATFAEVANFHGVTFTERAFFRGARFAKVASFSDATFVTGAFFRGATFTEEAFFVGATFVRDAIFSSATFAKVANFSGVTFTEVVYFDAADFDSLESLGPLIANSVVLDRASFNTAVVIEAETAMLSCRRTRFAAGAELRVRHSQVDLSESSFGAASSLSASATALTRPAQATDERISKWQASSGSLDHRPVLLSLRGIDVSDLALTDVDLRWCRFAGAHHLDKLRIEGDSPFPRPPRRWWRSSRQVLFEEHLWRARRHPRAGWHTTAPGDKANSRAEPVGATRLAALYRSLRKALEDGKNEAGAGDFYYGEQEARRRATESTSRAERAILRLYWLISGYGQRASRALVALAVLIATVTVMLVGVGLPGPTPVTQSSTTVQPSVGVAGQQTVTTITDVPAGVSAVGQRWTWSRAENAARIALGAVVFRDAGQKLTAAGTWTVMGARFLGPVLLALAALAIRARVKR